MKTFRTYLLVLGLTLCFAFCAISFLGVLYNIQSGNPAPWLILCILSFLGAFASALELGDINRKSK